MPEEKKLWRNCGSPNCENKLDTALDVKNSAEEKQSSYTPDGAATTPTQQPKKPNGGETKQNRSPNRCVMIQSFEQADHCFRNVRNDVECYRQQLTVLMDQVTGLSREVANLRSQQRTDREVLEKRRQENAELAAELAKGKREFEAFKRSLETKTLHQEVKAALGIKVVPSWTASLVIVQGRASRRV